MQSAGTFAIAAQLVVDENPEHVHVDLSQVTFIDSSGARGVYALVSLAAEHGVGCSIIGREDLFRAPAGRPRIHCRLVGLDDTTNRPPTWRPPAGRLTSRAMGSLARFQWATSSRGDSALHAGHSSSSSQHSDGGSIRARSRACKSDDGRQELKLIRSDARLLIASALPHGSSDDTS